MRRAPTACSISFRRYARPGIRLRQRRSPRSWKWRSARPIATSPR